MAKSFLMGNEAFAHAALEAGVRVCAGYPGTPSSEVIETIAKAHNNGSAEGVYVEWSTNEKAALELLAGAAYAGARTLYTCKQVGLNVASDALMSLNYVGVEGGTVLFVADDPGPISSQTEQDTRRFASFAKVPVFDPATPEQGCAMMKAAYDLSEKYRTPVIMRPTTRICHASTFFDIPEHTKANPVAGFEKDSKWVIFPPRAYQAHKEINERLVRIAEEFATGEAGEFNPCEQKGTAPVYGIVAGGISFAYAQEALRQLECDAHDAGVEMPAYRLQQIGTPYPFPESVATSFVQGLEKVIVFEELDYVLEDEMLKLAGKIHANYEVFGKLSGHTTDRGENTINAIYEQLKVFFGIEFAEGAKIAAAEVGIAESAGVNGVNAEATEAAEARAALEAHIPARPPSLCAGCPHRGSFYAVKTALERHQEAIFCGDIGCYTLGNAAPLNAVDTCLCMGAGITIAQGFSIVEPHKKAIAFVGDSTFFASGMTGIANAVYNNHDITIVVLDNATTAMTGSQPHPGTGATLMGPRNAPISSESVMRAMGIKLITSANPLYVDKAVAAAKEAINHEGPSAVIFRYPCASLTKKKPPAYFIANACAGCKKCVTKIGCPALTWSEASKRIVVDRDLCTGCGLCTDICEYRALACPTRKRTIPELPVRSQRLHSDDGSLSRFPTPQELAGGSDD